MQEGKISDFNLTFVIGIFQKCFFYIGNVLKNVIKLSTRFEKKSQDLPGDAEDSPFGALENVLKWLVPSSLS